MKKMKSGEVIKNKDSPAKEDELVPMGKKICKILNKS